MRMNLMILAMMSACVMGCNGFGPAPGSMPATDAGVVPVGDGGVMPRPRTDSGMEMPREEVDAGSGVDRPISGEECDPDRDLDLFPCELVHCDSAYLVCLGDSTWQCVPSPGALCEMPRPETDAGMPSTETDAGSPVTGTDAGPAASADAGHAEACRADLVQICPIAGCVYPGFRVCNPASGAYEGECLPFSSSCSPMTGTDAGPPPAVDAGTTAPVDAGSPAVDAGSDAGTDAGSDAGTDAGSDAGPTTAPTGYVRIRISATSFAETLRWCPDSGVPDIRFHNGARWRTSARASFLDVPMGEVGFSPYNSIVFCQLDTADPTPSSPEPSWNGYVSPLVTGGALNTRVATGDFLEVTADGRDIRAGTFYCFDTSGSGFRRVQVQLVRADRPLPVGCAGDTGR